MVHRHREKKGRRSDLTRKLNISRKTLCSYEAKGHKIAAIMAGGKLRLNDTVGANGNYQGTFYIVLVLIAINEYNHFQEMDVVSIMKAVNELRNPRGMTSSHYVPESTARTWNDSP